MRSHLVHMHGNLGLEEAELRALVRNAATVKELVLEWPDDGKGGDWGHLLPAVRGEVSVTDRHR